MIISARGVAHTVLAAVVVLAAVALAGTWETPFGGANEWQAWDGQSVTKQGARVFSAVLFGIAGWYLVVRRGAVVVGGIALAFALGQTALAACAGLMIAEVILEPGSDTLLEKGALYAMLSFPPATLFLIALLWAFFPAGRLPDGRGAATLLALAPGFAGCLAGLAVYPAGKLELVEDPMLLALYGEWLGGFGLLLSALVLGLRAFARDEPRRALLLLCPPALLIAVSAPNLTTHGPYLCAVATVLALAVVVRTTPRAALEPAGDPEAAVS
ncbi:hypothetical protein [Actinocorallia herbida]|nr:hypothetical protein [Actinocorallia herbida]